jgi:hypothetical protein
MGVRAAQRIFIITGKNPRSEKCIAFSDLTLELN